MSAKLLVQPAHGDPFEVPIGNTATIGRTRENTVSLLASPRVSRQHALIRCYNGYQYQLIDLGSRNGTFVNGQRVVMPVTLENNARIGIADHEIVFALESSELSDDSLADTLAGTLAGRRRPETGGVALLVCDIRGFSTISEKVPAEELAPLLGHWFREVGNLIHQSSGTVDKFIGDGVLAYWRGREKNGDVQMAYEVAQQLLALAAKQKWPVAPMVIAVALHYGKVTFSNIGVDAQRDATIIGDAVNTVFRLEALMKELGERLVLSEEFVGGLTNRERFTDLGEKALKGKQQLVRLFGAH